MDGLHRAVRYWPRPAPRLTLTRCCLSPPSPAANKVRPLPAVVLRVGRCRLVRPVHQCFWWVWPATSQSLDRTFLDCGIVPPLPAELRDRGVRGFWLDSEIAWNLPADPGVHKHGRSAGRYAR